MHAAHPAVLGEAWPSATAPRLGLPDDEVHLWWVAPEPVVDPNLLARWRAVLAPEETARGARFFFDRDGHRHLATRALVRHVLSLYAAPAPSAWTFGANEYGCPYVSAPARSPRFNLSHTPGMILCAVTRDRAVGVDVEDTSRPGETVTIADRYFSAREVRDLRALPAAAQRRRFFDYWTLKESYIKARRMGLSVPLDQFSFVLGAGGPIDVRFDRRLADRPERWQFAAWRPTPRHQVALAVERTGVPAIRVRVRAVMPALWIGPEECW